MYRLLKRFAVCTLILSLLVTYLLWIFILERERHTEDNDYIDTDLGIDSPQLYPVTEHIIHKEKGDKCSFLSQDSVPLEGCPNSTIYIPLHPGDYAPCWQVVEANLSYGFSAFVDGRDREPRIKVIGVRRVNPAPSSLGCHCRVWYSHQDSPLVIPGNIEVIPEGQYPYEYRAVIFQCDLPTSDEPYAVSLVSEPCETTQNVFYVNKNPRKPPHKENITCCIPPIHSNYNNATELVEWIETSLLLGASRLIFYDFSTGSDVHRVLEAYVVLGLVEVIKWQTFPLRVSQYLREKGGAQILYFGQSAAINDCLYKTMGRSHYTLFMDTDEFIFPKIHNDWTDLLNAALKNRCDFLDYQPGAYWVRNTFFDRYFTQSNPDADITNLEDKQVLKHLRTATLTKRRKFIWPYKIRTKYFAVPEMIEQAGIHEVHKFRQGAFYVLVQPDLALMHHYRYVEEPNVNNTYLVDTTAHRFLPKSLINISKRLQILDIVPGS